MIVFLVLVLLIINILEAFVNLYEMKIRELKYREGRVSMLTDVYDILINEEPENFLNSLNKLADKEIGE